MNKWDFYDWAIMLIVLFIIMVIIGAVIAPDSTNKSTGNSCKSHISACVAVGSIAVPIYSDECN
jgi:hypothetical protein